MSIVVIDVEEENNYYGVWSGLRRLSVFVV